MKTGCNTSTIIHMENSPIMKKVVKKSTLRQKRAKICIKCESNNEGFCEKHHAWCGRANYICLGIKNPYEYKVPSKTTKKTKTIKKTKKVHKKKSTAKNIISNSRH